MPRVLLHEMPDDWQAKMAALMEEWDDHWNFDSLDVGTRVQLTKNERLTKMPEWLKNYRHPDQAKIKPLLARKKKNA